MYGYACFNRYHVAAELQIGLVRRGLPMLTTEAQNRALAPFRRHGKFWEALAREEFKRGFPSGSELQSRLRTLFGLENETSAVTPRIKLHRLLGRILCGPASENNDPAVVEAMALLRRAVTILEKGGSRETNASPPRVSAAAR